MSAPSAPRIQGRTWRLRGSCVGTDFNCGRKCGAAGLPASGLCASPGRLPLWRTEVEVGARPIFPSPVADQSYLRPPNGHDTLGTAGPRGAVDGDAGWNL